MLQLVFRAHPDQPGVAHYIIHAYDYPLLAAGGVEAARRYASLAPDSPHALHMPSHISTRLGLWDEVIATNRGVVTAALKHGIVGEALHGSDYQVFGHLQKNEDDLARHVIDAAPKLSDVPRESTMFFAGLYATASMPARYAVERRQWAEAAALLDPTGFRVDATPGRMRRSTSLWARRARAVSIRHAAMSTPSAHFSRRWGSARNRTGRCR